MRVFRSLAEIPPEARNCAVTIGNFDGVHQGHKKLFRRNVELARENGWIASVLTFDPHPTKVVAPDRAPLLLTTLDQRLNLIAAEGIKQVFIIPFSREFSRLSPEEFVRGVLVDALGARAVLVGENFRFGAKQAGDTRSLQSLGEQFGFRTEVVPGVIVRGRLASSTAVRTAVLEGQVSAACRLLGRPYRLEGCVVSGRGIGSKQTVPTLNLDTDAEVIPATGVYITRTQDFEADRRWPSITNVGYRPTFDGQGLTIETYLLSPLEGGTPQKIRVEFLLRVREERKFPSPEDLKRQIMKDVGRAQTYFRRAGGISGMIL